MRGFSCVNDWRSEDSQMTYDDPLEKAFGLLKARSCERAEHQLELEEKLMSMQNSRNGWRSSLLVKVAAVAILAVIVVGVAEATTGAVSTVMMTVFFDSDDVTINEDGSVTIELDAEVYGADALTFEPAGLPDGFQGKNFSGEIIVFPVSEE